MVVRFGLELGVDLQNLMALTGQFMIRSNSGLPDNGVRALAIDGSNIWIGTYDGGVAKFDGTNWTIYNTSNSGMPDDEVLALAIDGSNIWIGTWGLVKFDGTNWTVYNESNSPLPYNRIYALAIDGSDNIWIGTYGGGLAKFDGANWRVYNHQNSGLPHDLILSLAIDGSNKWIGTWGGLAKFDGSNWTVYDTSNSGLPDDWVFAVAIDGSDNIWSGTWLGGLAAYREGGVIIDRRRTREKTNGKACGPESVGGSITGASKFVSRHPIR